MTDLAFMSITEVADLLRNREISPIELTRNMLDRIERIDSVLHSYRTVLAESALEQARMAEAENAAGHYRGPLHGVPIAVKDLVYTAGVPTLCGSTLMQDWLPDYDATVLRRLRSDGAIILGKLHMTEFAYSWHHPAWPEPVNPWNADRWVGVSSSGSGVATAAGLCYGSLGTDTGGSIRFPAACNGAVGLKPTYGRVSRSGIFPLAKSLDNIGPITRRVADTAVILRSIAGNDPDDPTSSHQVVPDYVSMLDKPITSLRLGVDERFIHDGVHQDVSRAVMQAIERLSELGLQTVPVTAPFVDERLMTDSWSILCAADAVDAHRETWPERASQYGPFRELLEFADTLTAADYASANAMRLEYAGKVDGIFQEIDLLICPAMTVPPPPIVGDVLPIPDETYMRPRFTYLFNFSNSPTLTMPCGFTEDDLPIAMQLVGPHCSEGMLLNVGHQYEQSTPWHTRVPLVDGQIT